MISTEQFMTCFPNNKEPMLWTELVCKLLPEHNINTPQRLCHFLAQTGHESNGFTILKENLNYSAEALAKTWPRRFPPNIAAQYARQPERIANRAYADRMGNGDEASGDGWKFAGKGIIQLTGRSNITQFSRIIGLPVDETVKYLTTKEGALLSACWYWSNNGLNLLADGNQLVTITRKINGGTNGLADRQARFKKIAEVLGI